MKAFAVVHAYLALCREAAIKGSPEEIAKGLFKALLNPDSLERDYIAGDQLKIEEIKREFSGPDGMPAELVSPMLQILQSLWQNHIQNRQTIQQQLPIPSQQTQQRGREIGKELQTKTSKAPSFILVEGGMLLVEGSLTDEALREAARAVVAAQNITVMNKQFEIIPTWGSETGQPIAYDIMRDDGTLFFNVPKGPLTDYQLQSLIYSRMTGKPSGVTASHLMDIWAAIRPEEKK